MPKTKAVTLAKVPVGEPTREDFAIVEVDAPEDAPADGLLVQVLAMSVDPYLRGTMRPGRGQTVGKPINAYVSGKVLKSNNAAFKAGDRFGANLPLVAVQAVPGAAVSGNVRNLTPYLKESEISLGIGLLGMPGSTAYAGADLLALQPTDRVWISTATGAVGSVLGQIAKNVNKAELVIGSAGSDAKCKIAVDKFSFDKCFNYKEAKDAAELTKLVASQSPDGITAYFENVGGAHFTAALNTLQSKGRIVVCGAIEGYNKEDTPLNLPLDAAICIYKQLNVQGLFCQPWLAGERGKFLEDMSKWWREGLVKTEETFFQGVESWPDAFMAIFKPGGDALGKVVVKV
ncbi:putative dehydrogenase [Hyaloraphidium curvatum]|nr:putative dehydrogenase [Hyaloraphidium curvatum]